MRKQHVPGEDRFLPTVMVILLIIVTVLVIIATFAAVAG